MAKNLSKQKKLDTRIDFTPMVDMNMLLITFFMFCTTMLKPQTLSITLPFHDDKQQEQQDENQEQVNQDNAITIIVDGTTTTDGKGVVTAKGDGTIWYYAGFPFGEKDAPETAENNKLEKLNLSPGDGVKPGKDGLKIYPKNTIQYLLQKRNEKLFTDYKKLEKQWQDGKMPDSIFEKKVADLHADKKYADKPVVMIKATGNANYADVVAVLDAMSIFQVSRFQIEHMNKTDSLLLEQKGVKLQPQEKK